MEPSPAVPEVRQIPIDQLKPNPWNRKIFDPAKLEELAASIQTGGIREPLVVRPWEGGYQIASGNRRYLAAGKAGLSQLPCLIQNLPDDQVAEMNITTNIQREDMPPLELAREVAAYMEQFHKTQAEAALRFGKSQTWVSQLTGFLKLPGGVLENIKALILGWDQLRALQTLPPAPQLQLSQELKEGSVRPDKVQKRANQLRFGGKTHNPGVRPHGPGRGVSESGTLGPEPTPDPLAEIWPPLMAMDIGRWGVSYGPHPMGLPGQAGKAETAAPAWAFWIYNDTPAPRAELKRWFLKMADAMGDTGQEEASARKVMEALIPRTEAEFKQAEEDQARQRLPQTPQEWAELETRAPQGPGAIYAWTNGETSFMAAKSRSLTWADLGETDPVTGCRKLIESLKRMQAITKGDKE